MKHSKHIKWSADQMQMFFDGFSNKEIAKKANRTLKETACKRSYLKAHSNLTVSGKSVKDLSAGQKAAATRKANKLNLKFYNANNENSTLVKPKKQVVKKEPKTLTKDLNIIVNGVPVVISNNCKRVFIGKDTISVEI